VHGSKSATGQEPRFNVKAWAPQCGSPTGLSVFRPVRAAGRLWRFGRADRCSALCQSTPWRTRSAASASCSLRGWPASPAPPSPWPPPGPPGPLPPPKPPSSAAGVGPETARASAGRGRVRGACAACSPNGSAQRAARQPRQARLPGLAWIRIACRKAEINLLQYAAPARERLKGPNHPPTENNSCRDPATGLGQAPRALARKFCPAGPVRKPCSLVANAKLRLPCCSPLLPDWRQRWPVRRTSDGTALRAGALACSGKILRSGARRSGGRVGVAQHTGGP